MSGFTDVEQFVREHRGCGALTPRTSAPVGGAYLLMVSCSCGKTFERWVNVDESEGTPLAPPPAPEPRQPEPAAIDITAAGAANESLEDVMKKALDALDTPKTPPARTPPTSAAPRAEATPRDASPPSRAPAASPAATPAAARESEAPKPDRSSLEDALRATLEALGDDPEATLETATRAPSPASRPTPRPNARLQAQPAEATRSTTPGGRPKPDKQALQDVLRATLTALEAERKTTPRGAGAGVTLGTMPREPAPPRRKLSIAGAVAITVALVAAVGAGYGLSILGHRAVDGGPAAAKPAARVRIAESERAVVAQTLSVLRDLQSVSRVDVPYRVYFNRVSFAKGDVERGLQSVKDADIRAGLNETMELHVLAAAAWRAKTLNERDKWEAVGDDPTVEFCPAAKRILAVSDEPPNISRSQWRGMALAAGVPLLWDCAAERLAKVERGLNNR